MGTRCGYWLTCLGTHLCLLTGACKLVNSNNEYLYNKADVLANNRPKHVYFVQT